MAKKPRQRSVEQTIALIAELEQKIERKTRKPSQALNSAKHVEQQKSSSRRSMRQRTR